jgi:hypothetical protein
MPKATKRKARRGRHRLNLSRPFGTEVWAAIGGQDMRVMHHFRPIDTGRPFQSLAPEHEVYLHTFRVF